MLPRMFLSLNQGVSLQSQRFSQGIFIIHQLKMYYWMFFLSGEIFNILAVAATKTICFSHSALCLLFLGYLD